MATRMKANVLGGMHTAGIYSDMTVDGPEIGTLVVIVDRAKNLPNRKTIGKQNPYCAARLGKEAKKTETDRRGGQTPRWDQELRFTVHDSADYYQLKVSVFNDDKRTDLIGETWVNLQDVVVPGGGQSDIWHTLTCKSKYAGEVRIEITYYDTRPKQDRQEKAKQGASSGMDAGGRDSLKGPRQPKPPVKRRPLPSDPVSGAPAPTAIPDHVPTPPRGYQSPTATPEHARPSPRGYQSSTNGPEYVQTPPRHQVPHATPEHVQARPRAAPMAIPDHVQTPPRGYQSPNHIPNQSPLQNVEYNTTASQFSPSGYDNSPNMNGYAAPSPSARPVSHERNEIYDPMARNDFTPGNSNHIDHYEEEEPIVDHRDSYNSQYTPYDLPQPEDFGPPPSPGGPPPPPPAHGSKPRATHTSPAPALQSHGSYGFPGDSSSSAPYDSPTNYAHRHSIPTYSQSKSYQGYIPTGDEDPFHNSGESNSHYQESPPRHHSYDGRYNHDHGSMQPTVEDAPPSPSGGHSSGRRGSGVRSSGYDDRRYDEVPSPAPLNLSGRGGSPADRNAASNTPSNPYSNSMGYTSSASQLSMREQSYIGTSISSRTSFSTLPQQHQIPRKPSNAEISQATADYGLPPVPATLVAGMDPLIAQELADRIYDEKRASYSQSAGRSSRGRHPDPPQYQPNQSLSQSYQEVPPPFAPASASYDERQSRMATATVPVVKPRAISPDPRTPMRKSVSPSPIPSDGRRLSGVPFGPDSYNALNPKISGSTSTGSLSARYDPNEPDPDAKIITHDGREIDPSDHIPESNYAPLLEQKGPKYASQLPDRNYRPPPSNSQPSSGRRQLKQAARPQSMAATSSSPIYMNSGPIDPLAPQNGRNRLQKKANRMSALPAPHSSPLAPITPYQNNSHTPSSGPRPSTADYHANENYAQSYGPGYRGSSGPPPIPAKIPVDMHSAPPPQTSGGDAWALLEEMKNIDLGSGRARRRGH
ncbi:C2 (Calcium CaLB) [Venustampulla echinocandica]|uniref:C2 (Calcium CaLB) n=1 Tax=Venustampulla echinocandica TaxID=2656787 RepID=A0A370TPT3_9HELO|nr:C2 (Calcium CaLB) [Venustampulla echinocandica]RDL37522.1 C2 (Calcium CaLB) [Venustampulla echinocandica]